jgi:hypothetical protein
MSNKATDVDGFTFGSPQSLRVQQVLNGRWFGRDYFLPAPGLESVPKLGNTNMAGFVSLRPSRPAARTAALRYRTPSPAECAWLAECVAATAQLPDSMSSPTLPLLSAFQVSLNGRFWMSPEAQSPGHGEQPNG